MSKTSNMQLDLPAIGIDEGVVWAEKINNALEIIDEHDHTTTGKTLTNAAFNITEPLQMAFQPIEKAASISFDLNATPSSSLRSLYQNDGDLYFRDKNGVNIRLTSAGTINVGGLGAITGMDATSSVAYSTGLKSFTFSQSAGVAAKISSGSISIANEVLGSQAITLSANPSSAAYNIVFDAIAPSSNQILAFASPTAIKYRSLLGTANQITVTPNTNDFTFSFPNALSIVTSVTVPTVSATTVGATTGNITTVNSTTVNSTTTNATNGRGILPIGAIIATLKGYTGAYSCTATVTPDSNGFVLCQGQVLTSGAMSGVTVPNITDGRFLRGSTTSGTLAGSNTKNLSHTHTVPSHSHNFNLTAAGQSIGETQISLANGIANAQTAGAHDHRNNIGIDLQGTTYRLFHSSISYAVGSQNSRIVYWDATPPGPNADASFQILTAGGGHGHLLGGSVNIQHTHAASSVSGSVGSSTNIDTTTVNTGSSVSSTFDIQPAYLDVVYILRAN
jgi:hypothetical protein